MENTIICENQKISPLYPWGEPPPAKPLKGGVQNHSPALPVGEAMLNTCVCHLYWIILYADKNCWDNRITRGQTIGS